MCVCENNDLYQKLNESLRKKKKLHKQCLGYGNQNFYQAMCGGRVQSYKVSLQSSLSTWEGFMDSQTDR